MLNKGKTKLSMKDTIILGIKGGFANQLFQYSVGYSVAKRNNFSLKLDLSFFNETKFKSAWRINLLNVEIIEANISETKYLKNENNPRNYFYKFSKKFDLRSKYNKATHYIDNEGFKPEYRFHLINTTKYMEGWFPKPGYFNEFRHDLIKMYTPKFRLSEEYLSLLNSILTTDSVSIHVRRGDYVDNKIFLTKGRDYYTAAIKSVVQKLQKPSFYVFSDDIEWCRENLSDIHDCNFIKLGNNNADLEEFFLMKNCKHNVIANSSFSWWAAYLNENPSKIVIAPKVWYKDAFYQTSLDNNPSFLINWITI